MINLFDSTKSVKSGLSQQKYIASDEIGTIVYLSQKLGKPLLTEGPAGVGKTELAKAIAGATERELGSTRQGADFSVGYAICPKAA